MYNEHIEISTASPKKNEKEGQRKRPSGAAKGSRTGLECQWMYRLALDDLPLLVHALDDGRPCHPSCQLPPRTAQNRTEQKRATLRARSPFMANLQGKAAQHGCMRFHVHIVSSLAVLNFPWLTFNDSFLQSEDHDVLFGPRFKLSVSLGEDSLLLRACKASQWLPKDDQSPTGLRTSVAPVVNSHRCPTTPPRTDPRPRQSPGVSSRLQLPGALRHYLRWLGHGADAQESPSAEFASPCIASPRIASHQHLLRNFRLVL